jgi:hypothetical protein
VALCLTDHIYVDRSYLEVPGDVVVDEKTSILQLEQWAKISSDSLIIPRLSHPGSSQEESNGSITLVVL